MCSATHLAMQEACEHMRAGNGPTIVEVDVYRYFHQNGAFPGSAFGYRSKDEEKAYRDRDAIKQLSAHLERREILDSSAIEKTVDRAKTMMAELGDVISGTGSGR